LTVTSRLRTSGDPSTRTPPVVPRAAVVALAIPFPLDGPILLQASATTRLAPKLISSTVLASVWPPRLDRAETGVVGWERWRRDRR